MKQYFYSFSSDVTIVSRQAALLSSCAHCGKMPDAHVDGKCLFEATEFSSHVLRDFFEDILYRGGNLTITSGKYTYTQRILSHAVDATPSQISGDLRTHGVSSLVIKEEDGAPISTQLLDKPKRRRKKDADRNGSSE